LHRNRWRVANDHRVLQCRLQNDGLPRRNRRRHQCRLRYLGECTPEAANPNWIFWIALLELDPDPGADLRNHEGTLEFACDGYAGHGPGCRHQSLHVRHDRLNSPALLRIYVVHYRSAVFAVISSHLAFVHAGTLGRVEIKPLRLSSKLCLYSPAL